MNPNNLKICILFMISLGFSQPIVALADCGSSGKSFILKLKVQSCEKIIAEQNPDFQQYLTPFPLQDYRIKL
jgi:hypothetical protein